MRLSWAISTFPELNHLSDDQRRSLLQKIRHRRVTAHMIALAVLAGGIAGLIAGFWTLSGAVAGVGSAGELVVRSASAGVVTVVVAIAVYQVQLLRVRSAMRLAIMRGFEGERVPVCLACGYDVQGARDPKCPECGATIVVPRSAERGGV